MKINDPITAFLCSRTFSSPLVLSSRSISLMPWDIDEIMRDIQVWVGGCPFKRYGYIPRDSCALLDALSKMSKAVPD